MQPEKELTHRDVLIVNILFYYSPYHKSQKYMYISCISL